MPRAKQPVPEVYEDSMLTPFAAKALMAAYVVNEEEGDPATPDALSNWLKGMFGSEFPTNTLTQFTRKLQDAGLSDADVKREISFTRKGKREAESVVRRYRLAERMVVDIFQMSLHQAPGEARSLFCAISPTLEANIDDALGQPTDSPFGYPIPGQRAQAKRLGVKRLPECTDGEEVEVYRIPVSDEAFLLHLIEQDIVPGRRLQILGANEMLGTVSFQNGDNTIVMSSQVSGSIWVADPDDETEASVSPSNAAAEQNAFAQAVQPTEDYARTTPNQVYT